MHSPGRNVAHSHRLGECDVAKQLGFQCKSNPDDATEVIHALESASSDGIGRLRGVSLDADLARRSEKERHRTSGTIRSAASGQPDWELSYPPPLQPSDGGELQRSQQSHA